METGGDGAVMAIVLNVLYLLSRYVHIVSAMLLVGGFLFYEMVVPIAIADLRNETQAEVFAKARWAFRWIIWVSATLLVLTGIFLTVRRMHGYIESEYPPLPQGVLRSNSSVIPLVLQTGFWWAAHVVSSLFAIGIALYLSAGDRPPTYPLGWLRLDLILLLLVVFFAVVVGQVDQLHQQRKAADTAPPWHRMEQTSEPGDERPEGRPAEPTTEPAGAVPTP